MKMTKVMNKNMEVAMVEGMMIGRCKGPIKAILPTHQEKIEEILAANKVQQPIVEGSVAVKVEVEEDIDMEDYKRFCDWMINKGGEPSIEEYKKAVAYYTNLNK